LLVANAGILVSEVIYVKHGDGKTFVIVDAAMNDLIRPTLYEAYHDIWTVRQAAVGAAHDIVDVVGPVCESGDYLALGRSLPGLKAGDLITVMSAGAYGAVQACTYNTRPLVPEVLVKDQDFAVIRARESYETMIARDVMPAWL
jgi:diaminopimelate decarboxylase